MPYLSTLIISFLATLSLASPVARQADCPPLGGSGNQNNFKLVAVSAEDSSDVSPLAIGSNVYPSPGDDTYLGVESSFSVLVADVFALDEGGMTAYDSDLTLVGVSQTVDNNNMLPFVYPGEDVYEPAELYCSVINQPLNPLEDPYPYNLWVDGNIASFYLCPTDSGVLVVYILFGTPAQFKEVDTTDCTSVDIHIVPEAE